MTKTERFEQVEVTSSEELRAWLEANHTQDESVWLITYKKDTGDTYVSTDEILDELLCFGWVDGIRRKLDANRTMQLIAPRKAQHWAKSYKDRAARLIEEGRMHDAGRRAIETSKASGMWTFMDDVDALVVPNDLKEALNARPGAAQHFKAFPDATTRNILRWIKLAKKPDTRAQRIKKTADLAAENKRVPGM